jgi:hypothetical protein
VAIEQPLAQTAVRGWFETRLAVRVLLSLTISHQALATLHFLAPFLVRGLHVPGIAVQQYQRSTLTHCPVGEAHTVAAREDRRSRIRHVAERTTWRVMRWALSRSVIIERARVSESGTASGFAPPGPS